MMIKINNQTSLMYIHFSTGIPNVLVQTSNEEISKFVAKANRDQIIGYEVENFEKHLNYILTNLGLNSKQRLAVVLCYLRGKSEKTQKEFAQIFNISEGTYKNLERAEHNINFDTFDIIVHQLPLEKRFLTKIFID